MTRATTGGRLVLSGMLVLTAVGSAGAAEDETISCWNITVGEPPQTHPSWIKVSMKEGKHVADFLGAAGGVGAIGEIKCQGGTIEFEAHGRKWSGTVKGDTIEGTCVDGSGTKAKWMAKRADHRIDLTGEWIMKAPDDDLFETKVILAIKHEGEDIEGELKGLDRTVSEFELKDDILILAIDPGFSSGESGRGIRVKVKGDKWEGTIVGMDGEERRFAAERKREWDSPIELFNGKNLDGWKPLGDPKSFQWKVIDGIMTNTGGGGSANIVSERKFRDFKLHVEFRVPEGGNSGVYLRGRHEVQIEDSHGKPLGGGSCGAMYSRIVPSKNASKPYSEWQTFDITFIGNYVTVVLNGETIADNQFVEGITGGAIDSDEGAPGPIYLQGDHGKIEYRRIVVTPVKETKPGAAS